ALRLGRRRWFASGNWRIALRDGRTVDVYGRAPTRLPPRRNLRSRRRLSLADRTFNLRRGEAWRLGNVRFVKRTSPRNGRRPVSLIDIVRTYAAHVVLIRLGLFMSLSLDLSGALCHARVRARRCGINLSLRLDR